MSNNNFMQALKELTGFDKPEDEMSVSLEVPEIVPLEPHKKIFQRNEEVKNDISVITSTMKITGDIRSTDNIVIEGTFTGNLSAVNCNIIGGRVKGDSCLSGQMNVDRGGILIGNVKAANMNISGKVKGNLDADEEIRLDREAVIIGNICSMNLLSNKGAAISGEIKSKALVSDIEIEIDFGEEEV